MKYLNLDHDKPNFRDLPITQKMTKKTKINNFSSKNTIKNSRSHVTLITSISIAMIGILSALAGGYVSQKISAISESDKIIREKLESAYEKTLLFSTVATRFNMAALPDKKAVDSQNAFVIYNGENLRFWDMVTAILTPVDLYGNNMEKLSADLTSCAHEFAEAAVQVVFISGQVYRKGDYGSLAYTEAAAQYKLPVMQNALVAKRQECEEKNSALQKSIRLELRKHITRNIY